MRKCGFCRKPSKKLNQCWILKESLHGWRADPDFWEISQFITLYLCDDCSYKEYTLKHLKQNHKPIILEEGREK